MSSEKKPTLPQVDAGNLSHLEWLAFQYLCDDLAESQRAEFEDALASEPAAAEALSEMVAVASQAQAAFESLATRANTKPQLSEKLPEYSVQSRTPRKIATGNSLRWLAGLAAALLLLIGASQYFGPNRANSKSTVPNRPAPQSEIAELWSGNFEDELAAALEWLDENSNFDSSNHKTSAPSATEMQPELENAEEGWLYSALVSLESAEDWPSEGQGGS